jgi:hypothetical protein
MRNYVRTVTIRLGSKELHIYSDEDFEAVDFKITQTANKNVGNISSAPGSVFISISEFIFSERKHLETIVPLIVDMREEYFEALSQDRIWKARWIRIRGTWSFFKAIGLDRAFAFVSFFVKAWKSVS